MILSPSEITKQQINKEIKKLEEELKNSKLHELEKEAIQFEIDMLKNMTIY